MAEELPEERSSAIETPDRNRLQTLLMDLAQRGNIFLDNQDLHPN